MLAEDTRTFVERVLAGDALAEDIDDYVDAWHDSAEEGRTLHDFLGFSEDEYGLWVEKPDVLSWILMCRKQDISVDKIRNWDELHRMAARAQTPQESAKLMEWLQRTGRL